MTLTRSARPVIMATITTTHQCNNATVTTQRKRRITMNTEMTTQEIQEMDEINEIDEVVRQCTWLVSHGGMSIEKALAKVASQDHCCEEIQIRAKRLLEKGKVVCCW